MRFIAAIFSLTLVPAQAAAVDWKVYGTTSIEGGSVCFYDADGVTRTADRHLRVSTNCMLQKDLEGVDIKRQFGGKNLDNVARKARDKYTPPIVLVEGVNSDQALVVMQYEETANLSGIQAHSRLFFGLNCSEQMTQTLSAYVLSNGKESRSDKPTGWAYVSPESNGARLLKILCLAQ